MKKQKTKLVMTITIDTTLYTTLKNYATENKTPMSRIIEEAVKSYLEKQKR